MADENSCNDALPAEQLVEFGASVRKACGIPEGEVNDSQIDQEIETAARILWLYHLLDGDRRADFQYEIELLFDTSGDCDEDYLDTFMSEIGAAFNAIYDNSYSGSQVDLVIQLEDLVRGSQAVPAGDSSDVDEFESLAQFAEPLIYCKKVLENPELIEEMMMRAHDYWQLAAGKCEDSERSLASIISKYAQNGESPADIQSEAVMMIERFDALYGSSSRPNL